MRIELPHGWLNGSDSRAIDQSKPVKTVIRDIIDETLQLRDLERGFDRYVQSLENIS